ncbi:MAG: SH3 domain-containing protein [Leptolyngbyaceae cyanobacterium SL_7_1]|nr:SH3 domain-containing protein [Leptolyngbyaceae cyanobacterium SL_7_1]
MGRRQSSTGAIATIVAVLSTITNSLVVVLSPAAIALPKQNFLVVPSTVDLLGVCQSALAQRMGRQILITSNTLQPSVVLSTEVVVQGRGVVDSANDSRTFEFNCQVNLRSGQPTRVTHAYVEASRQPITAVVNTPESGCLNLRAGPGTEYRRTGCIADGRAVTLNGQFTGDWAQLGNGSWAYRPYLRIPNPN